MSALLDTVELLRGMGGTIKLEGAYRPWAVALDLAGHEHRGESQVCIGAALLMAVSWSC